MKKNSVKELVRSLKRSEGEYAFLIGAGTSRAAGIPTGADLIKWWKKHVYMLEEECIDDLEEDEKALKGFPRSLDEIPQTTDDLPDEWVEEMEEELTKDSLGEGKNGFELSEYGFWFEKACPKQGDRRRFIESIVENKEPTFGIIVLASLMSDGQIPLTLTPNFDDLLFDAMYKYVEQKPMIIDHNAIAPQIRLTRDRPKIIKLHGDYLYDNLQNTDQETSELESNMKQVITETLSEYGLVVIGYGGEDESIMDNALLEITKDDGNVEITENGIYWCTRDSEDLSENARTLLEESNTSLVEIEGSEEFFTKLINQLNSGALPDPDGIKQRASDRAMTLEEKVTEREEASAGEEKEMLTNLMKSWEYVEKGKKFYEEENYKEAIEVFSDAIDVKPDFAKAYRGRGLAYSELEKPERAIEEHTKAIEINPEYSEAYNSRGNAFAEQGKQKRAIEDFTEAIEIKPDYAEAYNYRGFANAKQGNLERAIEDYTEAVEVDPDYIHAYHNRCEINLLRDNPEQALDDAKEATNLSETDKLRGGSLMLVLLCKILLNKDITQEEKKYREICKKDFTISWTFHQVDKLLESADLSDNKMDKIKEVIDLFREHKEE